MPMPTTTPTPPPAPAITPPGNERPTPTPKKGRAHAHPVQPAEAAREDQLRGSPSFGLSSPGVKSPLRPTGA